MSNKLVVFWAKLSVIICLVFGQLGFTTIYAASRHKTRGVKTSNTVHTRALPSSKLTTNITTVAPIATSVVGAIPIAPDFDIRSYFLMDANSGYIIAEKNANLRASPASLTKMMTLYLVANALRNGQIHLTDQVTVSENAWRTGGSRMFIRVGTNVSIEELIKGISVASGNDATVAIAEHLAGSEQNFATLMNKTAHDLKMDNTNFSDSNGLPDQNNYSTAFDLANLAKAWITNFPEYYPWFKEKWIIYNGIKQPNRNRLLWRDGSVDGIKTGHTDDAGYCLVTSAIRNGMRLIAVVMGAKSDSARANNSLALLNYGFRHFETHKLFTSNVGIAMPRVRIGKEKVASLGLAEDLYVTLPVGQYKDIKVSAVTNGLLKAPIIKGKNYGAINVLLDKKIIATKPLVALKDNPRANFLFVMFDYISLLFGK